MDVGGKPLALRDRSEQRMQCLTLLTVQTRGDQAIVLACPIADLDHQLLAQRGQVQRMQAPVAGIAATFDVAPFLEFVEYATTRLGRRPSCALNACWLRPGSEAIARRIPACGGVRARSCI